MEKKELNRSQVFLSNEDNQELVYRCETYRQIENLAYKRRLVWEEFKAALPEMTGVDYDQMKAYQDEQARIKYQLELAERRKQAEERWEKEKEEREKRELARAQTKQLVSLFDEQEPAKKVNVADVQAFVKNNLSKLRTMNYGQLYSVAKEEGFCNSGFLFNQYKHTLRFYNIDYEKLREFGKGLKESQTDTSQPQSQHETAEDCLKRLFG